MADYSRERAFPGTREIPLSYLFGEYTRKRSRPLITRSPDG